MMTWDLVSVTLVRASAYHQEGVFSPCWYLNLTQHFGWQGGNKFNFALKYMYFIILVSICSDLGFFFLQDCLTEWIL